MDKQVFMHYLSPLCDKDLMQFVFAEAIAPLVDGYRLDLYFRFQCEPDNMLLAVLGDAFRKNPEEGARIIIRAMRGHKIIWKDLV